MRPPDPHRLQHVRGTMLGWDPPAPKPGAPAAVLLHGAAGGAWVWNEGFGTRLATAGHPTFAIDFTRGRGGVPAGLSDYGEDLPAALAAIRLPAVLVGHSRAAIVAQRLLAEAAVAGLVLLTPVPPEGLAWPGPTGGSRSRIRRSGARWRG